MPITIKQKQGRDTKLHRVYTVGEMQGILSKQNRLNERARDTGGGGGTGGPGDATDSDLQDLQDQIDTLNNVTIPDLQSQLDTLNNVTIPDLQGQIGTLNNVTIPDLDTKISDLNTILGNPPDSATFFASIVTNQAWIDELVANQAWLDNLFVNNAYADRITANEIAAGSVTALEIAADTITANEIAAGTITALEIAASTITANELNIAELNAITANTGDLTVSGILTMGTNGIIRNTNGDFQLDQDGYKVRADSIFGERRAYKIADQQDNLTGGLYGIDQAVFLASSNADLFLRPGGFDSPTAERRLQLSGLINLLGNSSLDVLPILQLDSGLIRIAGTKHGIYQVQAESGTTDTLVGIRVNFGQADEGGQSGDVIVIKAYSGHSITIDDGFDNIVTGDGDKTFSGDKAIMLVNMGSNWHVLSSSTTI